MRLPGKDSGDQYGIVIDAGSSGSRIQIYKWQNADSAVKGAKEDVVSSPPKIVQEKGWSRKTSPGISTFAGKRVDRIWDEHLEDLMEHAESIIPADKYQDTPVFVLATAGMRLLKGSDQEKILKKTCSVLRKKTKFSIPDCSENVQIIDGETEGIYGWLALNYLMGQFSNYSPDREDHESIGFMDMGGASTQIAFVPSSAEEIQKHDEDLSTVTLRNINGVTQEWKLFVQTWLGFGANEARKRYLSLLINLAVVNSDLKNVINDPCMPKGAELKYNVKEGKYTIKGTGNYEVCLKTIYPLLQKNIPCPEEPCLFNGVHGPKLNFEKDKFVGISEYWYTANDVFQSGGEYNYHSYNEKVKEYCESDWKDILKNSETGKYSNLDSEKFLKDACFKASWVLDVLHEGFELPRLGLETSGDSNEKDKEAMNKIEKTHVPFKSADSINGEELSWTLGKILLYASSRIQPDTQDAPTIGIKPSDLSGKQFIPAGSISKNLKTPLDTEKDEHFGIWHVFSLIIFFALIYIIGGSKLRHLFGTKMVTIPGYLQLKRKFQESVPHYSFLHSLFPQATLQRHNDIEMDLEEGLVPQSPSMPSSPALSVLRTRSNINLVGDPETSPVEGGQRTYNNFINKPFVVPKKSPYGFPYSIGDNSSREKLSRTMSDTSVARAKR